MRMVIINHLSWAVGLQWTPPRLKSLGHKELLNIAQELRGDASPAFNIVARRQKQVAFGVSDGPVENWRNVRALAAFVPGCPSFLGLFRLEDVQGESFWWVFARHHGANVGTGDQVYASYEDAKTEINILSDLLRSRSRSGQIFEEQVTCSTPKESIAWLSPRCSLGVLHKVFGAALLLPLEKHPQRKYTGYAFAAVLICGLAWGGNAYLEYRAEQAALEQARVQAAHKAQRRQQLLARPAEHFAQDWQQAPMADAVGVVCVDAMLALPTVTSGWLLHSASCSGRSLSVRWTHSATADFQALPVAARLESPRQAISRTSLSIVLPPRSSQPYDRLLSQETVRRMLYQLCQSTSTRLQLSFQPPEKIKVDKEDLSAPWIKGKWELAGIVPADILAGGIPTILANVPGLTLDTIVLKNDTWTFQGRVYATEK